MNHACNLRSRRWLAGVFALASGLTQAADCPVDQVIDPDTVISSWPEDRSPADDTWNAGWVGAQGGVYYCGYEVNASAGIYSSALATPVSLASGLSEAHSKLSTLNIFGGPTRTHMATCSTGTTTTNIWVVYRYQKDANTAYGAAYFTNTTTATPCDPPAIPPEFDCPEMQGKHAMGGRSGETASYVPPDTMCVGGCETYKKTVKTTGGPMKYYRAEDSPGVYSYNVRYEFTGMECDQDEGGTQTASEVATEDEGERCVGDFCQGVKTGENCGFLNDKYVCVEQVQPDKCFRNEDGSVICAEAAPTPPKPDTGTPGVPAAPTTQVEACTGNNSCQTIQHFSSTTVTGSSRAVPQGSGPSGSGPIGNGSGEGDSEGPATGSASGGLDCSAPPTCTHDDPVQCAVLAQQWRTRCADVPSAGELESQFGPDQDENGDLVPQAGTFDATSSWSQAGWMGGNQCLDDYTISLPGDLPTIEIPFSQWCWLLGIIGIFVMIAAWMSAARIVVGGL